MQKKKKTSALDFSTLIEKAVTRLGHSHSIVIIIIIHKKHFIHPSTSLFILLCSCLDCVNCLKSCVIFATHFAPPCIVLYSVAIGYIV